MFSHKSILFIAPDGVVFPSVFEKNLRALGFTVYTITPLNAKKFRYKHIGQRLHNLWRKVVLGDTALKRQLILERQEQQLLNNLNSIQNLDYGLVIRPDLFPVKFIEQARQRCRTFVGYQWDGLHRYPDIKKYIPLVDRFYVFDTQDLITDVTLPVTNFYFDYSMPISRPSTKNNAYYLGSYLEERLDVLRDLNSKFASLNINTDMKIVSDRNRIINLMSSVGLTATPDVIPYEQNLKNVFNSNILIDIQNPVHHGLSFRIFEGVGYEKKVITTNKEVVNYDFYQPENFLIWEGQDIQTLKKFISTPFKPLDGTIKRKYSFSNWMAYMLNVVPHTPIALPLGHDKRLK